MTERSGGDAAPGSATATSPGDEDATTRSFWHKVKDHKAFVAITGVVIPVIAAVIVLLNLPSDLRDGIQRFAEGLGLASPEPSSTPSESVDPLLSGLGKIEIGMTRDAVAASIGQPLETADQVCGDGLFCDAISWPELSMSMYDLGHVEVRAIYDDSELVFFAQTIVDDTELPPVNYLGWNLGTLGEMTYRQAVSALPDVEPTSFEAHDGPQSAGYGEMFEAGAVSQYRGLYLASAPTGYGTDLDVESLSELAVDSTDASSLDRFRSESQPNTAGEFDAESKSLTDLIADNLVAITHFGTDL